MKFRLVYFLIIFPIIFCSAIELKAQSISIELGPDNIALNEAFTITVKVEGETLKSYDKFPDIPGLVKRGTSSSSSTNIFNGQVSRSQSITQTYVPEREGKITIPAFTINVNGKIISSGGKIVEVGPAKQQNQNRRYDPFGSDPFEDFFGRNNEPEEFVDLKEDAFFALTTDKNEVYVGEGVNTTLAFYVSAENRAPLQFHDLTNQLTDILQKVRPNNVWEENFNIENITAEPVNIGGKRYSVYKIFQATFFPLGDQDIVFPKVGLEMIKYQVAKSRSFFGQNRKETFKTFYSKPKTIKVKPLPEHPLKEQVSVGSYELSENINTNELTTGESLQYEFEVRGRGNISGISEPIVNTQKELEIYPPDKSENITRSGTTVRGSKSFRYYMIPKEPGEYDLSKYFQFIFFNTTTDKYDTLKSDYTIQVNGESMAYVNIEQASSDGLFYDRIDEVSNQLQSHQTTEIWKWVFNIFLVVAFSISLFILLKKS
ncbi:BatD family protein [Marivirga sp.]|uniref:BatD family protein n=1 Tax=Marivirga sp. TaxID=2018662 RepID=UPI002D7E5F40|nr:BatD family protein [Marivirga sp.]HET8858855.1 BatD family protein [Marivirga sp.]